MDFNDKKENNLPNNDELKFSIAPEISHGDFANISIINHSKNEFIIDFASFMPGMPSADITNRIILTPEHAAKLFMTLNDNIEAYEKRFGPISNEEDSFVSNHNETFINQQENASHIEDYDDFESPEHFEDYDDFEDFNDDDAEALKFGNLGFMGGKIKS